MAGKKDGTQLHVLFLLLLKNISTRTRLLVLVSETTTTRDNE